MIVNVIATGLIGLMNWIVGFFPTGSPWTPNVSAATTWLGGLYGLDTYFPITELMICLTISIVVLNARVPIAVGVWIWKRIRG